MQTQVDHRAWAPSLETRSTEAEIGIVLVQVHWQALGERTGNLKPAGFGLGSCGAQCQHFGLRVCPSQRLRLRVCGQCRAGPSRWRTPPCSGSSVVGASMSKRTLPVTGTEPCLIGDGTFGPTLPPLATSRPIRLRLATGSALTEKGGPSWSPRQVRSSIVPEA